MGAAPPEPPVDRLWGWALAAATVAAFCAAVFLIVTGG